jgi:hypothetical protein
MVFADGLGSPRHAIAKCARRGGIVLGDPSCRLREIAIGLRRQRRGFRCSLAAIIESTLARGSSIDTSPSRSASSVAFASTVFRILEQAQGGANDLTDVVVATAFDAFAGEASEFVVATGTPLCQ